MSRILRGVHFSALEYRKIKSKGCMHRTTASTTVCMNTGRILHSPSGTLLHVRSTLRDLDYVWRVCRHHGTIGRTITEVRGWVGASLGQITCKYDLYLEYYVENACLNVKNACFNVRKW